MIDFRAVFHAHIVLNFDPIWHPSSLIFYAVNASLFSRFSYVVIALEGSYVVRFPLKGAPIGSAADPLFPLLENTYG